MITAFLPLRVFSPEDFNFANRAATELRKQHSLWPAVDRDGEVVDVFLQARRDGKAAMRFFKRLLKAHGGEPRKVVTDNGR